MSDSTRGGAFPGEPPRELPGEASAERSAEDRLERRLLEALDASDEHALREAREDPELGPRLASLQGFLERSRVHLTRTDSGPNSRGEWSDAGERALVDRVLARTTRDDLSWRGDLRELGRFLRERLKASRALRLVAASFVAHLIAVPALAWYVHRDRTRTEVHLSIELPAEEEASFEDVEESLDPPVLDERGARLAEMDNARRRARYVLKRARHYPLEGDSRGEERRPTVGRLLRARLEYLTAGHWWGGLDEADPGQGLLERVLRMETLIDRYLLEESAPAPLALGLSDLALALERSALERSTDLGAAEQALGQMLLERARAYDLWDSTADFRPLEVPLPFEAAWLALLEEAAQGQAPAEVEAARQLARALPR